MSDISALQQELISNYIAISASVIYFYEVMITLSQEASVIWGRDWTATTWLYTFTRYSTVIINILVFIPTGGFKSCKALVDLDNILTLLQFLCFAWFSALRVYALLNDNLKYFITGLVFLLNFVPFGTNLYINVASPVIDDSGVCALFPTGSHRLELSLSLFTRISVIIGDALVIGVTWMKTAHSYEEARRLKIKAPLVTRLCRDGTIYFAILLIINLLQVFGANVPVLFRLDVVGAFFLISPPIIVCRFILNLRQVKHAGSSWVSGDQSHSLRFVGNMGQSLQFGEDQEEDDRLGGDEHTTEFGDLPEAGAEPQNLNLVQVNEDADGNYPDLDVQESSSNYKV